jgi:hypothetical protein
MEIQNKILYIFLSFILFKKKKKIYFILHLNKLKNNI